MNSRYHKSENPISGKARKLKTLTLKSENRICADCGAPDPKWASANIGVLLCLKCSDVHRSLGPDISKVLSLTLDAWSDSDIDSMVAVGGNSYANATYEAFLPKGYPKPRVDSSNEERAKFIRSKYELQEFLQPSLRIVSSKVPFTSYDSVKKSVNSSTAHSSRSDSSFIAHSSRKYEDVREFIGDLKVKIVRGKHLAVRDMLTSDPYVVVTLGQKKGQTTVKNSELNPVWNEEIKLSVPRLYGALKLQVYDHDVLSADDIMGEAEVDLQPMIEAAMAFGDPSLLDNMQIGKWFKTKDNALVKDSTVNIVDGKVKQEVLLKLQNVESGELELELEWMPLDQ